jgi:hypothetical protein
MTFGGDFHYENALSNFKNMDKLIKYVNAEVFNLSFKQIMYFTKSKFSNLMVVMLMFSIPHHHVIYMH